MSWWSWLSGGATSLGSDVYGAFHDVYSAVTGAGTTAITEAEKLGGEAAQYTSNFTTSIFLNWFFTLIVYPVVNVVELVMKEFVGLIMKGVGIFLGLIFALPDGLAVWFKNHIISLGIASPIAASISIGIVLIVAVVIGLLILKLIQLIVQEL